MQERSLYKTIRDDLLAIENSSLQPDQALPSERELCQRYGTSRMTVRHAVTELESLGSVYRMQGKGTFVSGRKLIQPLMQVSGFTEDMAKRGKKASSQILFAGEKKADAATRSTRRSRAAVLRSRPASSTWKPLLQTRRRPSCSISRRARPCCSSSATSQTPRASPWR